MSAKREELGGAAALSGVGAAMKGTIPAVKGTMLQAHLSWAREHAADLERLKPHLDPECASLLSRRVFPTDWVPFSCLIQIDRAIAAVVGGSAEKVFQDLGRHSATTNLTGVYKTFISAEPHHFFDQMSVLHGQFQNFGRWRYDKLGERSGRITLEGYSVFSPVYCLSATGYFEQALRMMHAPGPITISETSCQCAGEPRCVYDMKW
jgi:hypothetical protein